mmetsp:Transcript_4000/g.11625  ORF Transcript_4000/g.11625 Transcript_4000/m.11625 type:complete len:84 (-) Transcript_4000:57-308(-)
MEAQSAWQDCLSARIQLQQPKITRPTTHMLLQRTAARGADVVVDRSFPVAAWHDTLVKDDIAAHAAMVQMTTGQTQSERSNKR